MGRKHRGKRRKCWLSAFSPFSHDVFKRHVFQDRYKPGFCGTNLIYGIRLGFVVRNKR